MRFSLKLDGVASRGAERLREPLLWPAWFAVDDAALRYLAGDATASDFVFAPGPTPQEAQGSPIEWERALSTSALRREDALVGVGMLYTAGGASVAETQAAYQELLARVQAIALSEAARLTGLGALLAAFGGPLKLDGAPAKARFEKLRAGIDPKDLDDDLDPGLAAAMAAFRQVGEALGRVLPGVPRRPAAPPTAVPPVEPPVAVPPIAVPPIAVPPMVRPIGRPPIAIPPLVRSPIEVPPIVRPIDVPLVRPPVRIDPVPARFSDLAVGTVVAVTVQAWRPAEIAEREPLSIQRAVPARAALRASLVLSGRLTVQEDK